MEKYVLSMELQRGDRITDETGEWEIISRPYVSAGGELVSARVRRIGRPEATDLRTWEAHERLSVHRETRVTTPPSRSRRGVPAVRERGPDAS